MRPSPTPPRRRPNSELRSREHLTPTEVDKLIAAAGKLGRHGLRDSTMIMVAFRHGLRVSELVSLRWDQVDLEQGLLHVRRKKNGIPSTHPLRGPELRKLRDIVRDNKKAKRESPYVFVLAGDLRRAPPGQVAPRAMSCGSAGGLANDTPLRVRCARHCE